MSYLGILILLFGAAVFQGWLRAPAFFGGIEWPLMLSALYCVVLKSDLRRTLITGGIAGLLHDALTPAPLGTFIPFFLLISWGLYALNDDVFGDHFITYVVLGLLGGLLKGLYFIIVCAVTSMDAGSFSLVMARLVGGTLYGMACAPLLYIIVFKIFRPRFKLRRWIA